MKFRILFPSRDHALALEVLASTILEREIYISIDSTSGIVKNYYILDNMGNDVDENKLLRQEAGYLIGVQTYIGSGLLFEDFSEIAGLMRHPNYNIWWSSQNIKIPKTLIYEKHIKECKIKGLSANSYIARTQLLIIQIDQNISPDIIRITGYSCVSENANMNPDLIDLPQESTIHLIETENYGEALLVREKLTRLKLQSCIHPSLSKPIVAYISQESVESLDGNTETRRKSSRENYDDTDFMILTNDQMGIIKGNYIPING